MNLQIQDIEARMLLYGVILLKKMSAYVSNNKEEGLVIIIIQFWEIEVFSSRYRHSTQSSPSSPSSASSSSVLRLLSFVEKSGDEMSISFGGECPKIFYSLKQDFLDNTEFNHIGEVSHISKVKSVIIVGTIKCVIPEIQWYYLACKKCNKKVVKKVTTYQLEDGSGSSKDEISYECTSEDCIGEVISALTSARRHWKRVTYSF